jgi:hypothetical protein
MTSERWPLRPDDLPLARFLRAEPRLRGLEDNPVFRAMTFWTRAVPAWQRILGQLIAPLFILYIFLFDPSFTVALGLLAAFILATRALRRRSGLELMLPRLLGDLAALPIDARTWSLGIWGLTLSRSKHRIYLLSLPALITSLLVIAIGPTSSSGFLGGPHSRFVCLAAAVWLTMLGAGLLIYPPQANLPYVLAWVRAIRRSFGGFSSLAVRLPVLLRLFRILLIMGGMVLIARLSISHLAPASPFIFLGREIPLAPLGVGAAAGLLHVISWRRHSGLAGERLLDRIDAEIRSLLEAVSARADAGGPGAPRPESGPAPAPAETGARQ